MRRRRVTARGDPPRRSPTVEIHVRGGVAYVVRKDAGVRVILRDFDNDPKHGNPERHAAPGVIEGARLIHARRG